LINNTDHSSPESARTARRRRRIGFFFVVWTGLALLAVSWLVRRSVAVDVSPNLVIVGDTSANASLAQRIEDWFKLADINFHGMYPWILLAPYVFWLGSRFHLESRRWRVSLPVHLIGCALFAIACGSLAGEIGWGRKLVIRIATETTMASGDKPGIIATNRWTNGYTIISSGTPTNWRGSWGSAAVGQSSMPGPPVMIGGAAVGLDAPGGIGRHESFFFWKQLASDSFSVFLNVFAYAALVGIAHAVHFYRESKEREGRAAVLEAQLTNARLNALQAQLHPHFLFNALNAISTLLRRDTRAAQDALASFSDLLRMALSHSTQPEVLLREDVEFLRRYVEIQQTRLGDRLRYEEEIDPQAMDCLVPALLLQPLVENAIRHGIEASPDPGVVRVVAQLEGERLLVTVEDSGAGLPTKEDQGDAGIGIGLQNLRSRLETLYGAKHRLAIDSRPEGGVIIHVEMPLRRMASAEIASVAS
jgi:two-component sensor histidine kinase